MTTHTITVRFNSDNKLAQRMVHAIAILIGFHTANPYVKLRSKTV